MGLKYARIFLRSYDRILRYRQYDCRRGVLERKPPAVARCWLTGSDWGPQGPECRGYWPSARRLGLADHQRCWRVVRSRPPQVTGRFPMPLFTNTPPGGLRWDPGPASCNGTGREELRPALFSLTRTESC